MKISAIEIRLCRRESGMTGSEMRDGRGSELEFLVVTMKTDAGLARPIPIEDGEAILPAGSGLGIDLD